MSVFFLKIIAMVTMVIDHVGLKMMDNSFLMRSIGRMAFIIYAFLIAEGYRHVKTDRERLKKHIWKLIVLCLVTEIPYDLFDHGTWFFPGAQSVLPTLTLGYMALVGSGFWIRRLEKHRTAAYAGSAVICFAAASVSYLIRSEYRFVGVLLVVMFCLYLDCMGRMTMPQRALALTGLMTVYVLLYIWRISGFGGWEEYCAAARGFCLLIPGMFLTIVPLTLYNQELGYHSRWFDALYSLFYPLQFAVLLMIVRI